MPVHGRPKVCCFDSSKRRTLPNKKLPKTSTPCFFFSHIPCRSSQISGKLDLWPIPQKKVSQESNSEYNCIMSKRKSCIECNGIGPYLELSYRLS